MILGGYGNFGKRIALALARKGIDVLIAGRDAEKASKLAKSIGAHAQAVQLDVETGLADALKKHQPTVIVNAVGPFQGQGYEVARTAISHGIHYIDLADGRDFVTGIAALDDTAKSKGVAVITGASTVPALADAVLSEYCHEFESIQKMRYGISPGQGAERGLATTRAILSYVGKPLPAFPSIHPRVFGWQDLHRQRYPELGLRWMANCEVPDLDLLPARYGIGIIQFSAGLELGALHLGMWFMSGLVRLGLPISLSKLASPLLAISNWFNRFGSDDGGMHVVLSGTNAGQPDKQIKREWFILAHNADGPHIPTVPAILLAERLAKGSPPPSGAYPCLGLISLTDYLAELKELDVKTITTCQSIAP